MTRQALILGAGSQLAPFLTQRLAQAGCTGVCVSRHRPPAAPPLHPHFPWRRIDMAEPTAWEAVPGAIAFSILPLWLLPAHLPALAAAGVAQVIAFSSTSLLLSR